MEEQRDLLGRTFNYLQNAIPKLPDFYALRNTVRFEEISRGRSERQLYEWGMVFSLYSYFETMINDVTFGGYHKFGPEARILSGFEESEETNTPAAAKKPR